MQIWISCCSVLWEIDFSLAFLIFLNESFARFLLMLTFFCTYGWLCLPPNIFFYDASSSFWMTMLTFLRLFMKGAYLPYIFLWCLSYPYFGRRYLPPTYFLLIMQNILLFFVKSAYLPHIFLVHCSMLTLSVFSSVYCRTFEQVNFFCIHSNSPNWDNPKIITMKIFKINILISKMAQRFCFGFVYVNVQYLIDW